MLQSYKECVYRQAGRRKGRERERNKAHHTVESVSKCARSVRLSPLYSLGETLLRRVDSYFHSIEGAVIDDVREKHCRRYSNGRLQWTTHTAHTYSSLAGG